MKCIGLLRLINATYEFDMLRIPWPPRWESPNRIDGGGRGTAWALRSTKQVGEADRPDRPAAECGAGDCGMPSRSRPPRLPQRRELAGDCEGRRGHFEGSLRSTAPLLCPSAGIHPVIGPRTRRVGSGLGLRRRVRLRRSRRGPRPSHCRAQRSQPDLRDPSCPTYSEVGVLDIDRY